jgi:formate/nitrite transporter FocA (FNT family)
MLKISAGSAKFLSKLVMMAQTLAALFFGYLWIARRNHADQAGSQVPEMAHQYNDDTITAYAALAITCALMAIVMFFIRKSPRLMRLFTE